MQNAIPTTRVFPGAPGFRKLNFLLTAHWQLTTAQAAYTSGHLLEFRLKSAT
jgi:hypothetical protein